MAALLKPCLACGDLSDGPKCPKHRQRPKETRNARERGYDTAWTKLSKLARTLQPFCLDCGSTEKLEADHSPQAWERKSQGLPIRLEDIDVVCGDCNRARGAARSNKPAPPEGTQFSSADREQRMSSDLGCRA